MMQRWIPRIRQTWPAFALTAVLCLGMLAGCSEDDCVSCVEPPPVAPTQVYSESGDGRITVYWNDYPEIYNSDIIGYRVWWRFYHPGDASNPARTFELLDEVLVGQNYDADTGQYFYRDIGVDNAVDYEYAVSAYTASAESYLSFEFVVDTPLPMSESPLAIHDVLGGNAAMSGFDFSVAAEFGEYGENGGAGVVDPTTPGTQADVRVRFDAQDVPWLETMWGGVRVQDYGTFLDAQGGLDFGGVSWAPEFGWSESGVLELIPGHIYVVELYNEAGTQDLHYAKLGVVSVEDTPTGGAVRVMWAYQLVDGLPELAAPEPQRPGRDPNLQLIKL
ncbi:MAG: hypothetical protein R3D98_08625 [Candidatus Krumholzibacteriia bacterium]